MATGSKRQKIEEKPTESEDNGERRKRKAGNMFLRPDIILVVEGIQLHVRKEVLADNSPVFKRMFEADFKEKHQKKIPLPKENIEDFEEFLCLIYHPERWQITEDTVLKILPLADQYQVSTVKKRCESFIIQTLKKINSREVQHIDINTLLTYSFYVDKFQLLEALPLAVLLCAKHDLGLKTKAAVEIPFSKEMHGKICIERAKLTDTLVKNKMKKGEFNTVMETMDLYCGINDKDRQRLITYYERNLTNDWDERKITKDNLFECIIAGEQYNLKNLLSAAITLASKCESCDLYQDPRFNKISFKTRVKILKERVNLIETRGRVDDVYIE
ncbi:uncharacterized protein LOC128185623 [Crassostrea angulata]|uniref:uncharacterized protein LOC128185623 n=1 Tax=Magallana angulata TaxID=2784310 RepID=UPI0022B0B33C|nr:uncharacterized protein LOC128185623 [Crassostrea angulata]